MVEASRLEGFDLPRPRPRVAPPLIFEVAVAGVMIALATALRFAVDIFFQRGLGAPIVLPAVIAATLIAGGRSGLMVIIGGQLLVWYYFTPDRFSFRFADLSDALAFAFATFAQVVLLGSLVAYRAAERRASVLQQQRSTGLERALALADQRTAMAEQLLEQERALVATRRNLEAIYQASGDGLVLCQAIWNEDGRLTDYQVLEVNRAHARLTGATREQMLSQPVSRVAPPFDPRWFTTAEAVLKAGGMQNFDVYSRATGRWLNIRVSRVSDQLFQQTFVDISDRLRLEDQRRALMKEMSHRVMNNFQMIAGFLHVQSVAAEPAARAQLQTAERRVQVLARLHSFLAYTESEGEIDAAAYVRELCGYLASLIDRPQAVGLICEADPLRLPTDTVVPLGFVISELVANSVKYAYPPPMAGVIRVTLREQAEGWALVVEDHGRGMADPGPAKAGGLGTRLVQRFVQQIGAQLLTTSQGGVRHEITWRRANVSAPDALQG